MHRMPSEITAVAGSEERQRDRENGSSVTQQVTTGLLRMLRSGLYPVGSRLPSERELTELLDVGRSAVREGTRELVALGILEIQRGRGVYVKNLRPDMLLGPDSFDDSPQVGRELIEVRLMVEPEAAALAAVRRRPDDLTRLAQDVDRLAEAVKEGFRPAEDLGFHLDVVHATRNRALVRIASAIVYYYQVDLHIPTDDDVAHHRAIYEAIDRGDPDEARERMHAHVSTLNQL